MADVGACLELPSFAKINWFLEVEGRRPDGYHQITTVFQTVDLHDRISFAVTSNPAIELTVAGRPLPTGKGNLLYKAVAALSERARVDSGLRMHLEKRIPVGGGLGGGSSNAAVGLLAANHLWKTGLGLEELAVLGSHLGADVPFFLSGGTALGMGRGDRIFTLPDCARNFSLVLLYPGFPISTRRAYQARDWGLFGEDAILTTDQADTKIQRFRQAVTGMGLSWLRNDFEEVLFELYPALARSSDLLKQAGCDPVMLSGSGSCLFGVADAERAESIAREVSQQTRGEVFLCHSLPRQEYRNNFALAGLELII